MLFRSLSLSLSLSPSLSLSLYLSIYLSIYLHFTLPPCLPIFIFPSSDPLFTLSPLFSFFLQLLSFTYHFSFLGFFSPYLPFPFPFFSSIPLFRYCAEVLMNRSKPWRYYVQSSIVKRFFSLFLLPSLLLKDSYYIPIGVIQINIFPYLSLLSSPILSYLIASYPILCYSTSLYLIFILSYAILTFPSFISFFLIFFPFFSFLIFVFCSLLTMCLFFYLFFLSTTISTYVILHFLLFLPIYSLFFLFHTYLLLLYHVPLHQKNT